MENKSKGRVARAYRISDDTVETLKAIADKENCTETAVIENAIRYYRDYLYVQNDGAFITESVKRTVLASVNLMESRLNNRTNKVLSELQSSRPYCARSLRMNWRSTPARWITTAAPPSNTSR